jgi:hypothetical protein
LFLVVRGKSLLSAFAVPPFVDRMPSPRIDLERFNRD